MKKKQKLTVLITIILILFTATTVQATYQSRSSGTVVKNALVKDTTGFMTTVRQMEASGQVMGLSETINTSSGEATSASNNIDVHMQKNTEYGAMLILGVSDYGKQTGYIHQGQSIANGGFIYPTTTGNKSGVYELGNDNLREWVAGGGTSAFSGYRPKYFNSYGTTASVQHRGDATVETLNSTTRKGWQQAGNANWLGDAGYAFCRANGGGAFSYNGNYSPFVTYSRSRCCRVWCWILMMFCPLPLGVGAGKVMHYTYF